MILQALKPHVFDRLDKFVGRWVGEVPAMLWGLRMTLNQSTGFTPFFMVYGTEVVLSTDLNYGAPRVLAYDKAKAKKDRQDALDQPDEAHETALLRSAKYQQALRKYHPRVSIPGWRPRPMMDPNHQGHAQADAALGRTFHHR